MYACAQSLQMHFPFNRDLPSPLSGLWSYNLREKDLYEINCLLKTILYVGSLAGRRRSVGVKATSDPSSAELHPRQRAIDGSHQRAAIL